MRSWACRWRPPIRIPSASPTSTSSTAIWPAFGNPTSSPFQINDKYYQMGRQLLLGAAGKHSFRFGGEYRYNEFPQIGNEFPRGQFYFDGRYTNQVTASGGADRRLVGRGHAAGRSVRGDSVAVSLAQADFRSSEWAAYIDDTWRVRPEADP